MKKTNRKKLVAFSLFLSSTSGCLTQGSDPQSIPSPDSSATRPAEPQPPLKTLFSRAALAYDVPAPILEATAYAATRWSMVVPKEHDHRHGQDPAYGVMALGGELLQQAASHSGLLEQKIKFDAQSNIFAAAAWFSHRADELAIDRDASLGAWSSVIADFAGLTEDRERWSYVEKEVFATLRNGVKSSPSGQDIDIAAISELKTELPAPKLPWTAGPDYPASLWKPSGNHSARPSGRNGTPQMIIIHSCEGNYAGCTNWLRNKKSKVSAHYVLNSNGSETSQLIRHARKAWHIGANYRCNLNQNTLCELDGVQSNGFTIGIEHAGFASQDSWDPGLIDASAKLACAISKQHGIPRDAQHIVGHGQLQQNRSDPGQNWPWQQYIQKVREHCGDEQSGDSIIVDNNNANNDPQLAQASASGNWKTSSATAGHWASDYHFAEVLHKSDAFQFAFYLDHSETRSLDAWWTSGSNRSTSAPFIVFDAEGNRLDTVYVDQSQGSDRWNHLGRFHFTEGWNYVLLSRWTDSPEVVIADAIRVR